MRHIAIVPVYNEETTLEPILDHLRQLGLRVLCLSDGSTDRSPEIIERWIERHPGNLALLWDRCVGVGGAMRLGFEQVRELFEAEIINKDDRICTIDADGEHDPRDLLTLIAVHERTGADVTQGVRNVISPFVLRRLGNRLLSAFANLSSPNRYQDVECGMRCISLAVIPRLLQHFRGDSYGVGQELAAAFALMGAVVRNDTRIRPGPVRHRTRPHHLFQAVFAGLRTRRRGRRGRPLPLERSRPPGYRRIGEIDPLAVAGPQPSLSVLVSPPTGDYIREDRCQAAVNRMFVPFFREPIDLLTMATAIQAKGGQALVFDYPAMNQGYDDCWASLRSLRPDYLVVSSTDFTIERDLAFAEQAKRVVPGMKSIVKGPTFRDVSITERLHERFPTVDYLVGNDYAGAVSDLVTGCRPGSVNGVTHRCPESGRILSTRSASKTATNLAMRWHRPSHHLTDFSNYRRPDTGRRFATVETSRGCFFTCNFCLAPSLWGEKVNYKAPEEIVDEVAEVVSVHAVRDFFFLADCFTLKHAWVHRICDGILERGLDIRWVCNSRIDTISRRIATKMAQAGCDGIALGIESGNQDTLDRIAKGIDGAEVREKVAMLRELGITTLGYFMLGFPWEDERAIRDTIEFACTLDLSLAEFNLPIPFHSTGVRELFVNEDLIESSDLDSESYGSAVVRTRYLSSVELETLRRTAYLKFYGRPGFLLKRVKELGHPVTVSRIAGYALRKAVKSGFGKVSDS